eukprot:7777552-Pyramimonas_sp.AAC.1
MPTAPVATLICDHPADFLPIHVDNVAAAFAWCGDAIARCTTAQGVTSVVNSITHRKITFSSSFSGVGTDKLATDIIQATFETYIHGHNNGDTAHVAKFEHLWAIERDSA